MRLQAVCLRLLRLNKRRDAKPETTENRLASKRRSGWRRASRRRRPIPASPCAVTCAAAMKRNPCDGAVASSVLLRPLRQWLRKARGCHADGIDCWSFTTSHRAEQINYPRRKRRGISAEGFCQFYRSKLRGIEPIGIKPSMPISKIGDMSPDSMPGVLTRWLWGRFAPVHDLRETRAHNKWFNAYVSTFLEAMVIIVPSLLERGDAFPVVLHADDCQP